MMLDGHVILAGGLGSLIAGSCTVLGAVPALVFGRLSVKAEAGMLGFAAGVMLAASVFSLIIPGLDAARVFGGGEATSAGVVVAGILLGGVALWLLHTYAPHEHFISGPEGGKPPAALSRVWLFIIAITLHNFPEGLAVGVGFGGGNLDNGIALATGIGIQNIPEGLAVAAAMLTQDYSRMRSFAVASLTGLVEPIGGLVGATIVSTSTLILPWGLAFAAGAMLWVISDEIIPETHRKGVATIGTAGVMAGFVLMMYLDVTLG